MSRDDTRAMVFGAVKENPRSTSRELAVELPVAQSTVTDHLKDLVDTGTVERVANIRDPKSPLYLPSSMWESQGVPADD